MKKNNSAITIPVIIFLFLWWAIDLGTAVGTLLMFLFLLGGAKILGE